MNDDDFEKKLCALTGASHRPDPTPAWKADILARARREAEVIPLGRKLPPRWLMFSWAAAWAAIVAMNVATPEPAVSGAPRRLAAATAPTDAGSPQTLLAFYQRINFNPEIP